MMFATLGLGIAKQVFQIRGVDERGNVVLRRRLHREQVAAFLLVPWAGPSHTLIIGRSPSFEHTHIRLRFPSPRAACSACLERPPSTTA
jgi:hypothetical protein